jgi:hypothetical protein
MNDFVYEQKAGDGVFIYVIDQGVQLNVKNVSVSNLSIVVISELMLLVNAISHVE